MPIKRKIRLLISFMSLCVCCSAQIQVGGDIDGEFVNDEFGTSVSMSADGKIVAIGGPKNTDTIFAAGHVRVFQLESGEWTQLGNDINGKEDRDWFGYSVAISDDGNKLAVGSYRANGIRVFEYKNDEWIQLGQDINGGQGSIDVNEVAISSDGTVVAVGASHFPYPTVNTGVVRLFEFDNDEWIQLGNEIIGEMEKDQSGWSVSLSSDGKTVAIGSINNNNGGDDSGQIRVFRYNESEWIQLGKSINGKGKGYSLGRSVSLSANGDRIVAGGHGSLYYEERPCYVGVYEFVGGEWTIVGQELDGYTNEGFGWDVVISDTGDRIAVASPSNKNCPVRIFDLIDGEWRQVGHTIKNKREIDATGYSIGMSGDGRMVTAGSTRPGAGYAHIYDISDIVVEENLTDDCGAGFQKEVMLEYELFPNPTSGFITVRGVELDSLRENKKLKLFDVLGRKMEGFEVTEDVIDLNQIPAGTYFLMIDKKIEKIIKVRL